jgi:hypothetical protein
MLSLRKNSQHTCSSTCKWIPLPPLNKEWTDDEVYKHFKLSEDDVIEIEVKPNVKKVRVIKPKKLLVIEDDDASL